MAGDDIGLQSSCYYLRINLKSVHEKLLKNPNDQLREKYDAIKAECDLPTDKQTKGAQIRARVKWIEEGERTTRTF